MKCISSLRMKAIDRNCECLGLLPVQLMENAGAVIAQHIREKLESGRVLFIAGRGNNGGDAFVAARHLAGSLGYIVNVVLLGKSRDIGTKEAFRNFSLLKSSRVNMFEITDSSQLEASASELFQEADLLVDAVFGTGISGKLREPESTAIDLINLEGKAGKTVISIDIPSGLDPDGGDFEKAVHAGLTVTFHRMKIGLLSEKAKEYTGVIKVADIGICTDAEQYVGPGDLMMLRRRKSEEHKGDSGKILVIGGGPYSGAPTFAALAALKAGADLVTVAVPAPVAEIVASYSPNLIVRKLSSNVLCPDDLSILLDLISSHDVVVMGMGLGRATETLEAVRKIIPFCRKVVLDADALSALSGTIFESIAGNCELIVTPHAGEFARLRNMETPDSLEARIKAVREFSEEKGVVTLLKGKIDIISDGKQTLLNRTGNPGMTVGGTGDVLAGLTGSLFSRNPAFFAAACAAYINGTAGDLAFEKAGNGLLATDVLEKIPEIIKIAEIG
ncbi:NAD(P)H-hydrate dehydratase [Methanosarcina sp.]|uniref:NAD(P)H-hydrate dehydratase n=1 Tax=Methanosarcina sp. TaxID=2213 RepID=UPI002988D5F3|nr:NAD(P)H-hydrate dehydratase [Methanosarcina sp.]MDW5550170.1 NAD(P)H-hydrate dehydratase [Methanosarcina sp.]MDW5555297.1 NAD(P)H-hydrate dehydratase [Methanosarcina sp.]MDW5560548.1 NAD(P)H-hydrate dehydratase [Methanosarcina sp.]